MKSKLTSKTVLAHSSNYSKGRSGYKVCKITPHHMSGVLSGQQCAKIFQNKNRNASANYCIGVKGDIVCSVEEENRAWTSSSKWNDCQAITIEVSNSKTGGKWPISDASWKALINLCVDICKRYKFRLNYNGTKNGSLTRHNMYADTDCPGKYLQSKLPELAKEVNKRLDGSSTKKGYSGNFPSLGTKGYLSKGDNGGQVKRLQKFLNWCIGAKLTVDGDFGSKTEKAVKNFQKKYGLTVDGYFGKGSLAKAKSIKK